MANHRPNRQNSICFFICKNAFQDKVYILRFLTLLPYYLKLVKSHRLQLL
jgi:penicillin-binding protein-related factor A (putative recombinase)